MVDQQRFTTGRPVVLGFFAHPDDETLSAGGLLAHLASRADVHVVTATRGEMGEVVAPEGQRATPDRAKLPVIRSAEVRCACAHLGVTSHEFLDGGDGRFKDSGMAWEDDRRIRAVADPQAPEGAFSTIDIEEPAQLLAQKITNLRPTLVLTEEPAGGYGHPDHIRCHDVTMRALQIAARSWVVPYVAFAVQEAQRVHSANVGLTVIPEVPRTDEYGLALRKPDLAASLPSAVSPDVDLVVDTTAVTGAVANAMRAHRSQVHAVGEYSGPFLAGWYALTNNDLKPILTHVGLNLAPGWGTPEGLEKFFASLGVPMTSEPAEHRVKGYGAFLYAFALFSGVVVGFAGSFAHRGSPPWGLVIALVGVLAGAVMSRTIGSAKTAFTYAAGLIGSVLIITTVRTGGDVIIVEDALGLGWLTGIFIFAFIGTLIGGGMAKKGRRTSSLTPGDEGTHVIHR